MKYLNLFKTSDEFAMKKDSLLTPNVAFVEDNGGEEVSGYQSTKEEAPILFSKAETTALAPATKFLTFHSEGMQTISLHNSDGSTSFPYVQYSFDKVNWSKLTSSPISFSGDIYLRGSNEDGFSTARRHTTFVFGTDSEVSVSGNIMHLVSVGEDLVDIPNEHCFAELFRNCSVLVNAPELPATNIKDSCYYYMFSGTKVTSVPTLPSMYMDNSCYEGMFAYCTSLVSIPATLPAIALDDYCYKDMFKGCTSIVDSPSLPSTILAEGCYDGMFSGCTSLSVAPLLPSTTLKRECYRGMFEGCVSLEVAPYLPAVSLRTDCYKEMFKDCANLNYIHADFINTPSEQYTEDWVKGVMTEEGEFVKNDLAEWDIYADYAIPTKWRKAHPEHEHLLKIDRVDDGTFVYVITNGHIEEVVAITIKHDHSEESIVLERVSDTEFSKNNVTLHFSADKNEVTISVNGVSEGIKISEFIEHIKGEDFTFTIDNSDPTPKSGRFLTFSTDGEATIKITSVSADNMPNVEFSLDGEIWSNLQFNTAIEFNKNIYIRGNNPSGFNAFETNKFSFSVSKEFECRGNIMHLLSYTEDLTEIPNSHCFNSLFRASLITTPPSLPATKLSVGCYRFMFLDCKHLTSAPLLNATELYGNCYQSMFEGCTSLESAPQLTANKTVADCYNRMFKDCVKITIAPTLASTNLGNACYKEMFYGCSSLVSAPSLPAMSLPQDCYNGMFKECTNLESAPILNATEFKGGGHYAGMFFGCTSLKNVQDTLPALTLDSYCYKEMFSGCISLTTAPKLPSTELANGCYQSMFWKTSISSCPTLSASIMKDSCYRHMFGCCKNIKTAPTLASTSLAPYCYNGMFCGCTSLSNAPSLPSIELEKGCYRSMFQECSSITSAPTLNAQEMKEECYSLMFADCSALTDAPSLDAVVLAKDCYYGMFSGCSNLTTAPSLSATELAESCYECMFGRCTSLTTAPILPALHLAPRCYAGMFGMCNTLSSIKAMFLDAPSINTTIEWVKGVSANGTFTKNANATWEEEGINGIPQGWTILTE